MSLSSTFYLKSELEEEIPQLISIEERERERKKGKKVKKKEKMPLCQRENEDGVCVRVECA